MIHVAIGNRHEYWEAEAYNRPIGDWRRRPFYVCYVYETDEIESITEFTIIEEPFDWNDNMSKVAIEDFSMIQHRLTYGTCQSIGMALAKLELLEKQGAKVKEKNS